MNILFISHYSAPKEVGVYHRHFEFAKLLVERKHKVQVAVAQTQHFQYTTFPSFKGMVDKSVDDGVSLIRIKTFKYVNANSIKRIMNWFIFPFVLMLNARRLFNSEKPEVIIVSSPHPVQIMAGIYLKRKYKAKLIFEVRDIWPQTLIDVGKKSTKHPVIIMLLYFEKLAYKKSDYFISTLPFANEKIESVLGKPVRFKCIPQGFNPAFYNNEMEQLPQEYVDEFIPKDKFVVCYAGTIGLTNALETFVDTARYLSTKENSRVHLLIVGDGVLKQKFKEATADLANITFAPRIPKEQVDDLLKYCDLAYDSVNKVPLYDYGLSRNKWIDYMIAKKPLLISFSGRLTMLNEADCGFRVDAGQLEDLANKLTELSQMEPTALREIGVRGREYIVSQRSFDTLTDHLEEVIKSL